MNPEVDIYGVYIPTLGVLALVSYFLNVGLQKLITHLRFQRFIWHHDQIGLANEIPRRAALLCPALKPDGTQSN